MTRIRQHDASARRFACLLSLFATVAVPFACGGGVENGASGANAGGASSSEGQGGAGQGGANQGGANQGGSGGFLFPVGVGGGGGGGGAPPDCNPILKATVRDFSVNHADFEYAIAFDPGIVATNLGADGKPVYAGMPTTPTTTGKDNFDQWYRDVPGVNVSIPVEIPLMDAGNGTFTYTNSAFFPIDGQGLGDEGNIHNYHFTLELRTQFTYKGGEVFTFTGDDDLFTFINGKLAIDLGGVHGAMSSTIDLDARAVELGIVPGNTYSLDFFFAERHTSESNFRIDTTIGCFTQPPVPN